MIGVLGINFESAPLSVREKFSFTEDKIVGLGNQLKTKDCFTGLVVLSTCNRSEFYFQMQDCCETAAYSYVLRSLKQYCGIEENIRSYFYMKAHDEAFKHLFYVVSGANSMVLGEYQIVNQVKRALQISVQNNISDTELSRLFTKALEANKKIRTKTKINHGSFSVSYAGVEKCMSVFPDIKQCSVLVVGAGETGNLTLKSLIRKGCTQIVITNRTFEKADRLAETYSVKSARFDTIQSHLKTSDIIIISTSSQVPLITKEMVYQAGLTRNHQKQVYIDLSVPRNVSPDVAEVENVIDFDVDDLQEAVNANQEKRKNFITTIDLIIDEYLEDFNQWLSGRNLVSVISTITTNFRNIQQNELEGFINVNKASGKQLLEDYGSHITEKYIRLLIKNLKEVTNNGQQIENVKMLHELFEIR